MLRLNGGERNDGHLEMMGRGGVYIGSTKYVSISTVASRISILPPAAVEVRGVTWAVLRMIPLRLQNGYDAYTSISVLLKKLLLGKPSFINTNKS